MTDKTQPAALRLAEWCDANSAGIYRESAEAAAELRRQHICIAELEAQIEALSGVQALSAAHKAAPQQEAQEPVAWMWQHEETGRTGFVDCWQIENGFQENNPQLRLVAKLYTAPQPAPAPLSDDTERLEWLLWKLPGDALRYVVGELADTSSGAEFRAAIDAALAAQGGKDA